MQAVVNAIFYVVEGSIKWRMHPHEYPHDNRVSIGYFAQWRARGAWQRLHDTWRAPFRQQAGHHKPPTAGCLDSQSVKTMALGASVATIAAKRSNGANATYWSRRSGR
jgi:putative transposase